MNMKGTVCMAFSIIWQFDSKQISQLDYQILKKEAFLEVSLEKVSSQPTFTCSMLTIETEQGMKYA